MQSCKTLKPQINIYIGGSKKIGGNGKGCIDSSKVFDESKCVLHLIDMSLYDSYSRDSDYDEDNMYEPNQINRMISDQHIELWGMMKRGDLVEDISRSGYRSAGRYIVDEDSDSEKTDPLSIVRHGLIVKNLSFEFDEYGTILPNMYTITEFPVGYFDNIVVNNYICSNEQSSSYWHCELSPICLDTKKLKLDKLTKDNIFHKICKRVIVADSQTDVNDHYLYIIITYRGINYMLYGLYKDEILKQNIELETKKIIKSLKKNVMFGVSSVDENAIKIAREEDVLEQNILNIF